MTTTCEHGREQATCPECGVLSKESIAQWDESMKAKVAKPLRSALEAAVDLHDAVALGVAAGASPAVARAAQAAAEAEQKAAVDAAVNEAFGGMRPLTDVEERWVRMKHPEMSRKELDALIAEGLPADVPPITRDDLPADVPNEPHAFSRDEWERRKRARKTSAANRTRNRRVKKTRGKHAKKRSG